ncbi:MULTISPECIES: sulfite exporter TauE/SafE family protein [unclassified Modestobacter]|uniref:sulfite exporter TauE/SafE family protein n=1 Tax=unclassified Modestobacter TaxID=2643866 RepID=UPI0022AA3FCA|nr:MULTISPECIES: sulfite exporter TauE/SafE family protein [unclassified Modestobacter]MCZ2825017.1 sulfite exporter TauE/SafE family protein [Modestobacter sp. VKM Ac-2981]MCZ2854480.1 sulfite exporter TauE/SafE family protein [Modestobacter sp. VKM Ac-2982]
MSVLEFGLLVLTGLGAGLIGSIAGLASLISYPALLATGLTPVAANVTNTVALVLSGVGAVSASRPELTGQRARLLRLGPVGLLGGVVGAVLLLSTPSGAFEKLVPFLIAGAAVAILVQRPPRELAAEGATGRPARDHWGLVLGTFAASVYAGYFGAAAGVLLLAVYLLATGEGVPRSNALKNVVLALANGVAALGYAFFADVAWLAALPLAIGFLLGGRLGPRVVRRVPQTLLRRLIAAAGLALAVRLGFDAFS